MNLDEFTSALTSALRERGVPDDAADAQVKRLVSSLTDDSMRLIDNYASKESLDPMADELAQKLLNRPGEKKSAPDRETKIGEAPARQAEQKSSADDGIETIFSRPRRETPPQAPERPATAAASPESETDVSRPKPQANPARRRMQSPPPAPRTPASNQARPVQPPAANADDADTVAGADGAPVSYVFDDDISQYAPGSEMLARMGLDSNTYDKETINPHESRQLRKSWELPPLPEIKETKEGKRKFRTQVACASPLIAIALILYTALWGALFIVEGALIAGLIVALVALAAAGTLASIFGIIYGVVILSTRRPEGIFEIGLGIVVAGATLLAGVLVYNLALRFMPWVIKKTAFLCKYCTRKIHIAIINYKGRLSEK